MRILNFLAENIKRLKVVQITPDGKLVIIGGKNGAGKTSALDAIAYALGGAALCPEVPIRRGESSGRVEISLGEKGAPDLIVERKFSVGKGSTLTVKSIAGVASSTPQTILDKLTGKLTFDPLAFATMEPIRQRALLIKLVGLDTSDLDEKRKGLFDQRAEAGRDVHGRQTQIASMPEYPARGLREESAAEVLKELDGIQKHNREVEALEDNIRVAAQQREDAQTDAQLVRERVADLEARLASSKVELLKDEERVKRAADRLESSRQEAAKVSMKDEAPARKKLADLETLNREVRANQARAELKMKFDQAHREFERLDGEVRAVDAEKAARLKAAKFPVEGLGFSDAGVTMNGLPFEQGSSAEQLRVSVAMGLALNPTLRVLLIRDGSLLDADNLRTIGVMAAEADAQVWIERVGEGDECAVVIEDGRVKA